jgi:hypothetical protein
VTIASVTLPADVTRRVLTGPAGLALDTLVAGLIGSSTNVETIKPGTHYRLDGPAERLDALALEVAPLEGYSLTIEMPPTDTIAMSTTVVPSHPFVRAFTVHGIGAACSFVARAIDQNLTVTSLGINRWQVTGRSTALVDWLAEIYQKTADEVLAIYRIPAEAVAAEDSPTPTVRVELPTIPVNVIVELPDRKTVSTFDRDREGTVTTVVQLETTV